MVDIIMPLSFCNLSCKSIESTTGNPDQTFFWPYGTTCVCINLPWAKVVKYSTLVDKLARLIFGRRNPNAFSEPPAWAVLWRAKFAEKVACSRILGCLWPWGVIHATFSAEFCFEQSCQARQAVKRMCLDYTDWEWANNENILHSQVQGTDQMDLRWLLEGVIFIMDPFGSLDHWFQKQWSLFSKAVITDSANKYGIRFRMNLKFRMKWRFRMNLCPKPHMIMMIFVLAD